MFIKLKKRFKIKLSWMTVVVKAKDRTWLRNCVAALCASWCEESMNE